MPAYISPFDDRFMKLGRAATLAAEKHSGLDRADVMDMLGRSVFCGAFDPAPVDIFDEAKLRERDAPTNWLHVPIETPPARLAPAQARLDPKPQEYFAATHSTIASVMLSIGALPGDPQPWSAMLDDLASPNREEEAFAALAKIPFDQYPDSGRRFLQGVYAPRAKLKRWFALRLPAHPQALKDETPWLLPQPAPEVGARPKRNRQGRPPKAAWAHIEHALLKLRAEHPRMQKKELAFEARRLVAAETGDNDLPSVAKIQRRLPQILGDGDARSR